MSPQSQTKPVSSRYRWVICGLLFFATTFNYMDRQVISYLKEFFCRPAHQVGDVQTFSKGDFMDLPALAGKLKQPTNAISAYVSANLSPATLALLANYSGSGPIADSLQTNLVPNLAQSLNAMVAGQPLFDAGRFAGVTLHPDTRQLLASNPRGAELQRLNRLLLDDAFPQEISRDGFGWSNTDFANLTSFFTAFYAGMTIIAGWVIDKIGTKIGLSLSLIVWSLFQIANAFVGRLVMMHILVRSAFAVGEGGNFPASIKTVAEWFPKSERALATGIFNSGSNFGAMVAALFVPWCMVYFGEERGWKMAFIITGAAGFLWLIFWFWLYEIPARQKRLSKAEFDYIHSDKDEVQTGQEPAKGSIGKLFSFAGRIPRAAFWGTMILIGILTLFIYLMTSLIATHGAHLYVPGGGVKQIIEKRLCRPQCQCLFPVIPHCLAAGRGVGVRRPANQTLARPRQNRLAGFGQSRAGDWNVDFAHCFGIFQRRFRFEQIRRQRQSGIAGLPADLVVFLGEISHRRHLVVLSFLAAGLSEQAIWHDP